MLAIVVGLLQLPVDERPLRLGAALQEHAAVLHAVHAPVLHAASQAVRVVCSGRRRGEGRGEMCAARVVASVCMLVGVKGYRDAEGLSTGRAGLRS